MKKLNKRTHRQNNSLTASYCAMCFCDNKFEFINYRLPPRHM
ncbi:hypothetical protein PV797_04670 [Clostridiaceae bacterium M8S5]|nr:hypothetical protein PV797_04670 [Clostridiaceae bacterium M8S5]